MVKSKFPLWKRMIISKSTYNYIYNNVEVKQNTNIYYQY